jgi:hypothetical protein
MGEHVAFLKMLGACNISAKNREGERNRHRFWVVLKVTLKMEEKMVCTEVNGSLQAKVMNFRTQ